MRQIWCNLETVFCILLSLTRYVSLNQFKLNQLEISRFEISKQKSIALQLSWLLLSQPELRWLKLA